MALAKTRPEDMGMTPLSMFGLFAVLVMVLCYAMENRHPAFILAFAVSCVLASVYGFLQGAWPFGLVEAVWSVIAIQRWWTTTRIAAGGRDSMRRI
jgi:hypothetical protein